MRIACDSHTDVLQFALDVLDHPILHPIDSPIPAFRHGGFRDKQQGHHMMSARMAILRERRLRKAAEKRAEYTEAELLVERRGLARLEQLTARLSTSTGLQLLNEVLVAVLDLQQADFGNIQLYDEATCSLDIVVHRGFQQEFLDHFRHCHDTTAVCSRALWERRRILVEDVNEDFEFAIHRAAAAAAGFRAVQSTPLYTRRGAPLGVISTHFRNPHRPSERELRFTDLLAKIVAELIERHRTEEALRVSEERFRRYFDLGLIGMAITSVQKGCIEVNDELCRMLGYDRSELLSKSWLEMTHPEDVAADVAQFERALAGEIDAYTLDKRWVRKDGRVIHSVMSARCARRPRRVHRLLRRARARHYEAATRRSGACGGRATVPHPDRIHSTSCMEQQLGWVALLLESAAGGFHGADGGIVGGEGVAGLASGGCGPGSCRMASRDPTRDL